MLDSKLVAHYYQIPMFSTAGCSDAKSCDGQHGVEISQNILMAAMSGGNLIHDVGYMESGMCTSLQSLVIADEVISQVKRLVKGIEVNEETLALDIIAKVGPGGNFVAEEHTFHNFKKEWFFPKLFNRRRYTDWEAAGKPDLSANAQKKLLDIIEKHQPKQLNEKLKIKVHEIVESLPQTTDLLILNDISSGVPMAIMDSAWITAMRTPAVTVLAAAALHPDAETFGMFGCGIQGIEHVNYVVHTLKKLKKIYIYDIHEDAMNNLINICQPKIDVPIVKGTPEEIVKSCKVLSSATIILKECLSVVKNEWVCEGQTILPNDLNTLWDPIIPNSTFA